MAYTIIDILDKFIAIEKFGHALYAKMSDDPKTPLGLRTLFNVFASEENRHIETFTKLKEKFQNEKDIEIDFGVYDKASKLIADFSFFNNTASVNTKNELLEFCLKFESENLALLITIQGILVQLTGDNKSSNYKVLSILIKEEQRHINQINGFLRP